MALKYPKHNIIIYDNFSRRKLVSKIKSDSLTPILPLKERVKEFEKIYSQSNLFFIEANILDEQLFNLIKEKRPEVIYHLAQQPSSHYSMKGVDESIYTIRNNEEGNLRLLWAIKENAPKTHLVKLGSFGEYAECGLDIAEGYFYPEQNGKKLPYLTPFPREADDVYHVSKINDTNFISMACRKWRLKVTDVMQSTIFGVKISEFGDHEELFTRFDYDEYFGTVINRFLTQAVLEKPLTVYGSGNQRNGLMALEDAVLSLSNIYDRTPDEGEHQVINHVVEGDYSINELALLVRNAFKKLFDKDIQISKGQFNPRLENLNEKKSYHIQTNHVENMINVCCVEDVLEETVNVITNHKNRIRNNIIDPSFSWL